MTRQNTGVAIIGVPNPNEGTGEANGEFIAQMSTPVSHVLDNPGELWENYGVSSQPSMVFITADGTFERSAGALGPQGLLSRIEALTGT